MTDVLTLTMNPSIDLSVSVERIAAFHKMRCSTARRDPGGGGTEKLYRPMNRAWQVEPPPRSIDRRRVPDFCLNLNNV